MPIVIQLKAALETNQHQVYEYFIVYKIGYTSICVLV